MTDYLAPPIPVGQPVHFAWTFSIAPYEVEFKWEMPAAQTPVTETASTWINGVQAGGPPTIFMDTTTTFHLDLVPTSGPGPLYWRVQSFDNSGNSESVDEGIVNVAGSPLKT
jgi:hypothetical protein